MSEYQYYEFQAIDCPLTEKEMGELRSYSTRARITPTSFVNDYSWGSFNGDEDAWMEKYFEAFLYLANWGTHVFKLRLPSGLLDVKTAALLRQRPRHRAPEQRQGDPDLPVRSGFPYPSPRWGQPTADRDDHCEVAP
jgi:hypothetical protein